MLDFLCLTYLFIPFAHFLKSGFLIILSSITWASNIYGKKVFPVNRPQSYFSIFFSSLCDLLSYLVYFMCGIHLGYCFIFLYKVNQFCQHHALSKPSVHWFVMLFCILSSYIHIICLWTLNYLFYSMLYSSEVFFPQSLQCAFISRVKFNTFPHGKISFLGSRFQGSLGYLMAFNSPWVSCHLNYPI